MYYYTNEIVNFLFEYSSEVFLVSFLFILYYLYINAVMKTSDVGTKTQKKNWGPRKKKEDRQYA